MTLGDDKLGEGRAATVVAVRTLHGAITVFFLTWMAIVFYAGIAGNHERLAYWAAGALVAEGAVVLLNGGDCPLGVVHHRGRR